MAEQTILPSVRIRRAWAIVRIATTVALVASIVAQLQATLNVADIKGRDVPTTIINFFSYFTMLSGAISAVVFLIAGIWLLTRGSTTQWEPRWMSFLLVSCGTYMIITGIVYSLLLRDSPPEAGTSYVWANEMLHTLAPIIFFFDVVFRIARPRLPWGAIGIALVFPIAWLIYTLGRGEAAVDPVGGTDYWYPYPFLNPHEMGGFGGVAIYCVGILAAIVVIAFLAILRTRFGSAADSADRRAPEPVAAR